MTTVLIGGGWADASVYEPFLRAAGTNPSVACLVVDEGDGAEYFDRFATHLATVAPVRALPVLVPVDGGTFDPSTLEEADGLLVCGGLTPAYASVLGPAAAAVREWLAAGRPYAGMSAGAAVAAARAVVGGYLWQGRVVCPPDTAEDLDELTVVDGLGLVPFAVDVHAAQWGTLGRLTTAVGAGLVGRREERVRCGEDFVPRPDIQREQRQDESVRSVGTPHRIFALAVRGDLLLEFLDVLAEDEFLRVHDPDDFLQNLIADLLMLRLQIE